jgi:hypothetical protein
MDLAKAFALGALCASGLALFAPASFAANLDFTVPTTSGFTVESYTAVSGTSPGGIIDGSGNIIDEGGFESLRLDVTSINMDILVSDPGTGNPYFDEPWTHSGGGGDGGLGSCRALSASAQCNPSSDDNLTISAGERLRFDFVNDNNDVIQATFGNFTFRNDDHNPITGNIQVSHDGGSFLIAVSNGVGDLTAIGASSFLLFNDQTGSVSNYYISSATVSAVPLPAAAWLFGSALMGFAGISRRRKAK